MSGTNQDLSKTGGATGPSTNIVTTDGLLFTANRTHLLGGNTLSFLGGTLVAGGADVSGLNSAFIVKDGAGSPALLWDWRNNGNVKLWQDTSFLDASDNTTFKLGKLFTGSATDGFLGFQISDNYYPITFYNATQPNSSGFGLRIGKDASGYATFEGNAIVQLTAGNNATLQMGNSGRYMRFNSNSRNVMIIDENGECYVDPSSTRGFGVGLTAPESKLHVKGDGTEPIFIAETSSNIDTLKVLADGSIVQGALTTEPNDADLVNDSISFWVDSGKPTIKHKDSVGTTANLPVSSLVSYEGSFTIPEASWSAITNYDSAGNAVYAVSVSGAVKGDTFAVYLDDDVLAAIKTAVAEDNSYAYCNVDGTVEVVVRVTSFITIPASSTIKVKCIK